MDVTDDKPPLADDDDCAFVSHDLAGSRS